MTNASRVGTWRNLATTTVQVCTRDVRRFCKFFFHAMKPRGSLDEALFFLLRVFRVPRGDLACCCGEVAKNSVRRRLEQQARNSKRERAKRNCEQEPCISSISRIHELWSRIPIKRLDASAVSVPWAGESLQVQTKPCLFSEKWFHRLRPVGRWCRELSWYMDLFKQILIFDSGLLCTYTGS